MSERVCRLNGWFHIQTNKLVAAVTGTINFTSRHRRRSFVWSSSHQTLSQAPTINDKTMTTDYDNENDENENDADTALLREEWACCWRRQGSRCRL